MRISWIHAPQEVTTQAVHYNISCESEESFLQVWENKPCNSYIKNLYTTNLTEGERMIWRYSHNIAV